MRLPFSNGGSKRQELENTVEIDDDERRRSRKAKNHWLGLTVESSK